MDARESTVLRPTAPEEDTHPHACLDGFVYLGYVVESPDDLDGEVAQYERIPCRRCAEEAEEAEESEAAR